MAIQLENFEVVDTEVGVGITFFATEQMKFIDSAGKFCLRDGDMIIHDDQKEVARFKSAASSRTLQSADEITLIGVTTKGEIVIDIDCEFDNLRG